MTLVINWPEPGKEARLPLNENGTGPRELRLAFALDEALVELDGDNLLFVAAHNPQTRLVLEDYRTHKPALRLADGTVLEGAELLAGLSFNELETGI